MRRRIVSPGRSGSSDNRLICAATAHINMDENGAPERIGGMKLLQVPTPDGKLTPELIDREAWGWGDEHRAQPDVLSITQSTELGTVYTPEELAAVCAHAHEHEVCRCPRPQPDARGLRAAERPEGDRQPREAHSVRRELRQRRQEQAVP